MKPIDDMTKEEKKKAFEEIKPANRFFTCLWLIDLFYSMSNFSVNSIFAFIVISCISCFVCGRYQMLKIASSDDNDSCPWYYGAL